MSFKNKERDNREEGMTDRLEGRNAVLEAINAGREINKIWILDPKDNKKPDPTLLKILREAGDRKIVTVRCRRDALDRMSTTHNHQGVIAAVASHEYANLEDILKKAADQGEAPFIFLLDEISSALDEKTEQVLYRRLFDRYPDKTVLFITHRTMVSEYCDDIIDMRNTKTIY